MAQWAKQSLGCPNPVLEGLLHVLATASLTQFPVNTPEWQTAMAQVPEYRKTQVESLTPGFRLAQLAVTWICGMKS